MERILDFPTILRGRRARARYLFAWRELFTEYRRRVASGEIFWR